MLVELSIENFAIIDRLTLSFEQGLITFTGETGAGKSIIMDAVGTLLGGRADTTFVRAGAERANVEGVFEIPESARPYIEATLEREELMDDPRFVTLGREIRLNGRNVARINGRTVNAGLLHDLGEYLVDVHGQSEHLSLLRVNQHLHLLDRYASAGKGQMLQERFSAYTRTYRHLQQVRQELEAIHEAERDSARRSDMLSYQIGEIEAARLKPGEDVELREGRNRLANAEGLANLAQQAILALDEGSPESPPVSELLGQAVHALSGLARLDPSQNDLNEQGQSLLDGLSDLAIQLRDYLENIEFNPKRLDAVEERLGLIQSLSRKYGETIPEILAFAENAQQQLDAITHAGQRIEELLAEQEELLTRLGEEGQVLSALRQAAADELSRGIETELADLHMSGAHFQVAFEQRPDPQGVPLSDGRRVAFDAAGLERVEFLIAPNPGEGFKPLAKIASGGETSRLMLALKNVLAQADQIPTLIFDEIDQGIGGRVGTIVGQKLWSLGRRHQVLCITHLPQLAAFGDQHFQVKKLVQGERTTTQVASLEGHERLVELAQMMGEVSEGTLRSARELIQTASRRVAS